MAGVAMPPTGGTRNLKDLILALNPITWALLESLVDPSERRIIREILAVARAGRGRREQDDGDKLMEMARLRRLDPKLSIRRAAAQALRNKCTEIPNQEGGTSIQTGGRVISKASHQNNLVKKYALQESRLQRNLEEEEAGRAAALRRVTPISALRDSLPPRGAPASKRTASQEKDASAPSPAGLIDTTGHPIITAHKIDGFVAAHPLMGEKALGQTISDALSLVLPSGAPASDGGHVLRAAAEEAADLDAGGVDPNPGPPIA